MHRSSWRQPTFRRTTPRQSPASCTNARRSGPYTHKKRQQNVFPGELTRHVGSAIREAQNVASLRPTSSLFPPRKAAISQQRLLRKNTISTSSKAMIVRSARQAYKPSTPGINRQQPNASTPTGGVPIDAAKNSPRRKSEKACAPTKKHAMRVLESKLWSIRYLTEGGRVRTALSSAQRKHPNINLTDNSGHSRALSPTGRPSPTKDRLGV